MSIATISERTTDSPLLNVRSEIVMPPDKSIFHRILLLGALSESKISIPISTPLASDVQTTVDALSQLGVEIEQLTNVIIIVGCGKRGFKRPSKPIDCRNSGTTARLLMGILASQNFECTLVGDKSLSKRPMQRLAKILNEELGADITCSSNGSLPVSIKGKTLQSSDIMLSVASAQIKSALLLAAYCSDIAISIDEPAKSRDHTERMMLSFGIDIQEIDNRILLPENRRFELANEFTYLIPGDCSSAAFFAVASAITRSDIIIKNLALNSTRTAFFDVLSDSGIPVFYENVAFARAERFGDVHICASNIQNIRAFSIEANNIPNLLDEIPVLSVLALFANGKSRIHGASELRVKESDRISVMVENLRKVGGDVTEFPDGLEIVGSSNFIPRSAKIHTYGDHRIAMAMAVCALKALGVVTIPDANVVSISFPTFYELLGQSQAASTKVISEL